MEDEEGERGNPWLSATAALVAFLIRGDITLVDASPVLGGKREILPALENAARKRRQGSTLQDRLGEGDEDDPLASIRLLSKEEYREEVGERMFALDMVGLAGS
jgi:hypothetical protein